MTQKPQAESVNDTLKTNTTTNGAITVRSLEEKTADRAEFGGPKGPEPTRYGDWEVAGRCSDF